MYLYNWKRGDLRRDGQRQAYTHLIADIERWEQEGVEIVCNVSSRTKTFNATLALTFLPSSAYCVCDRCDEELLRDLVFVYWLCHLHL